MKDTMENVTLDALSHSVIRALGEKTIKERERRSQQYLKANNVGADELMELLPKEAKPFDIAEVRNETHLREIIMDRVLETAAHNITAVAEDGSQMPLEDFPEEQRATFLNKIMMDMLDSNTGPGPLLRQFIALVILNYRMRDRLKALLPPLSALSSKRKRIEGGIAYTESQIKTGMFYFEAWSFFADGPGEKQSDLATKELVERLLKREMKD
jgi:hypothetical protein